MLDLSACVPPLPRRLLPAGAPRWSGPPSATCSRSTPAETRSRLGLKDELDLCPEVVAVADRTELPGRCAHDGRIVEDQPEGVADELHAGLEHERPLPVVEHPE